MKLAVFALSSLTVAVGFAQDVRPDRVVTLSVSNLQCPKCKTAVEAALKQVKGVTESSADLVVKTIVVTYDHHLTSAARLVSQLAAVKPLHGKPYEAALLLSAETLTKEQADKLITDLKAFKNPLDAEPVGNVVVDLEKKLIAVSFKPVKLDDPKDRGTDVAPLVNAAKKTVATVKAVAPIKEPIKEAVKDAAAKEPAKSKEPTKK